MSAFVVEKSHINAMLRMAQNNPRIPFSWYHDGVRHELNELTADATGQMLLDECVKSVSHRYPADGISELPGREDAEWLIPFQFYPFGKTISVVQALKLTNCYEYQSCEHPDWTLSSAKAFCQALKEHLISQLPGYDEAPWEWHEDIPITKPVRLI